MRRHLWRDGRLLATYKDGRAHLPAYLDDYAFLADALLELLQTRWRSSDLEFARQLADVLLDAIRGCRDSGGFFFTAAGSRALIHRSKTFADESLPSGNGVAASVLCRLGFLLGETPLSRRGGAHAASRLAGDSRLSAGAYEPGERPGGFLSLAADPDYSRRCAARRALGRVTSGALYAPTRMIFAIP